MAKAKGKGAGKKNLKRSNLIPGDPPIIVGGGGSSWIWIKKELEPQFVDPTKLATFPSPPDPATVPTTPANYYLFYMAGFTVSQVHVRDGVGNDNDHPVPNNPNAKKKHRTYFE